VFDLHPKRPHRRGLMLPKNTIIPFNEVSAQSCCCYCGGACRGVLAGLLQAQPSYAAGLRNAWHNRSLHMCCVLRVASTSGGHAQPLQHVCLQDPTIESLLAPNQQQQHDGEAGAGTAGSGTGQAATRVELHDEPHTLLDNFFYVSGHITRQTPYEQGNPMHASQWVSSEVTSLCMNRTPTQWCRYAASAVCC
jgi:hypothetical protein